MKDKNEKLRRTNNDQSINTILPSLYLKEDEKAKKIKIGLITPLTNECNDEEWLKAKHRILDKRTVQRNLKEATLNSMNFQLFIQRNSNIFIIS
jgi:hypothetical protein